MGNNLYMIPYNPSRDAAAGTAGGAPADRASVRLPRGGRCSRPAERRRCARHHRRRHHCPAYYQMLVKSLSLPGLLELAKAADADASGDLREGPGAAASAIHPALHQAPAASHAGHASRRRRAHPDVRGARRIADVIIEFVDRYATRAAEATGANAPRLVVAASSVSLSVLLGRITAVVFSRSG